MINFAPFRDITKQLFIGDVEAAKHSLLAIKDHIPQYLRDNIFDAIALFSDPTRMTVLRVVVIKELENELEKIILVFRSVVYGKLCRHFGEKFEIHRDPGCPPRKETYIKYCYLPPICTMHMRVNNISRKVIDGKAWNNFVEEVSLPAFNEYITTGSTKGLIKVFEFLLGKLDKHREDIVEVENYLGILRDPIFLRCQLNTLHPRRVIFDENSIDIIMNLSRHFVVMRNYYMHMAGTSPERMMIQSQKRMLLLEEALKKRGLNFVFKLCWLRYKRQLHKKFESCRAAFPVLYKFANESQPLSYNCFIEHYEFVVNLLENCKDYYLEANKYSIFLMTSVENRVDLAWDNFRSHNPNGTFENFIEEFVKQRPGIENNGVKALLFDELRSDVNQLERTINHHQFLLNSLFQIPFEAGRNFFFHRLNISFENRHAVFNQKVRVFHLALERGNEHTDQNPPLEEKEPPEHNGSEKKVRQVVKVEKQPKEQSALLSLFKLVKSLLESTDNFPRRAKSSAKNGNCHISNVCALLRRLQNEKFHHNSISVAMMVEGFLAIEQNLKAVLISLRLGFDPDTHNLVLLAQQLPFIDFEDMAIITQFNGCEMDARDIGILGDLDLTPTQVFLKRVYTRTFDEYSGELVIRLQKLFSLLAKIRSHGKVSDQKRLHAQLQLWGEETGQIREKNRIPPHMDLLMQVNLCQYNLAAVQQDHGGYIANIRDNFLVRLEAEVRCRPQPQDMRIHFSLIFQFMPWVLEDLLTILLTQIGEEALDYKHDYIKMIAALGMRSSDFKPNEIELLNRLRAYRDLRYPANCSGKVYDMIEFLQGKEISIDKPEPRFEFPKNSASHVYHELIQLLQEEYAAFNAIVKVLVSRMTAPDREDGKASAAAASAGVGQG